MTDRGRHDCHVPERFRAQVVRVFTGNTLSVMTQDGCAVTLRVAGLDGPPGPEGEVLRAALQDLVGWMRSGFPLRVVVRQRMEVVGQAYGVANLYLIGPNADLVDIRQYMKATVRSC